ncbi:MAG: glycosyltransferase family 4 protein [Planctomycetota bacterium]
MRDLDRDETPAATRPRLAYLLKKFPRLSETFVLNEILGQEALGREIHVFARRARDAEPLHPQTARLRATIETLPPHHEIDPWDTLFAPEWTAAGRFEELGRLVQASRGWGHPRSPSLLVESLYLLRRTAELEIRHVHTHFATDSAFVAMLMRELGGPTYSLTAHAKDIYRETVNPLVLDRILRGAEFAVTVCDANVDYLSRRLSEPALAKVRRLYNGVDLAAFRPGEGARSDRHFLSVGRLIEKKGFFVFLDALRALSDRGIDYEASIVGEGEERARLAERIAALELGDRVRLLGALDQAAVLRLMQEATVLCLPCLVGEDGNRDALPTVLLEALACGLPVVSTPVTGIPEILAGGRAGVLVPERDPIATADALEGLLRDRGRRAELARHGREHAEATFDSARIARTLHSWFEAALDRAEDGCGSPA